MSKVKNEAKIKNGLLQAIRAQLEHRAFWLYLLCDEAEKRGLCNFTSTADALLMYTAEKNVDLFVKGIFVYKMLQDIARRRDNSRGAYGMGTC